MKRNIILIVDDDPGVRKISELWIKTYFPDNEVLLASGVDEAIEILQNQPTIRKSILMVVREFVTTN